MSDVDTSSGKRRRNKRWPEALKREIVAATCQPGASVSVVARQYDVNANQVFSWRRRFLGKLEQPALPSPTQTTPELVPVMITPEAGNAQAVPGVPAATETIEIEVSGDVRIRVGSDFEARALKRVLDVLRKR